MRKSMIFLLAGLFSLSLAAPLLAHRLDLADIHKKKSLWQLEQMGVKLTVPTAADKDGQVFWDTLKADCYLADVETLLTTKGFEVLPDNKVELAPGRPWMFIIVAPKKTWGEDNKPKYVYTVEISVVQDVQAKRNEWVEFPAVTWQYISEEVAHDADKSLLSAHLRKAVRDGVNAFIAAVQDK